MAPYVKRFFQIDGNSPKKSPSKLPQSSPETSPPFVPFGPIGRDLKTANNDLETTKYERATGRLQSKLTICCMAKLLSNKI